MKIGIILYSGTGNTRLVAIKLEEALAESGHKVKIDEVKASGEIKPGRNEFTLTAVPDVSKYDGLVFASPVMAFSLNPVMKKYLSGITSLKGHRVAFLLTKHLPFGFTGANQAFGKMKKICTRLGADIKGRAKVVWSDRNRARFISDAVAQLCGYFA